MIYVHDATNKILSRDSNYVADGIMWPKFVKQRFCERSYHNFNFTKTEPEKSLCPLPHHE